jgi:hypothetical protein
VSSRPQPSLRPKRGLAQSQQANKWCPRAFPSQPLPIIAPSPPIFFQSSRLSTANHLLSALTAAICTTLPRGHALQRKRDRTRLRIQVSRPHFHVHESPARTHASTRRSPRRRSLAAVSFATRPSCLAPARAPARAALCCLWFRLVFIRDHVPTHSLPSLLLSLHALLTGADATPGFLQLCRPCQYQCCKSAASTLNWVSAQLQCQRIPAYHPRRARQQRTPSGLLQLPARWLTCNCSDSASLLCDWQSATTAAPLRHGPRSASPSPPESAPPHLATRQLLVAPRCPDATSVPVHTTRQRIKHPACL